MDGVHDLGGLQGFGPVPREKDYIFRAEWEMRAFALVQSLVPTAKVTADHHRRQLERIPPVDYLRKEYFDKWIIATEDLLVERGLISREELKTGEVQFQVDLNEYSVPDPDALIQGISTGMPVRYPDEGHERQFRVGDLVRTHADAPTYHTRVPRYVRGKTGRIVKDLGVIHFADSIAQDKGPDPKPCYTVEFDSHTLWGNASEAAEYVYVDLWEPYLEQAE